MNPAASAMPGLKLVLRRIGGVAFASAVALAAIARADPAPTAADAERWSQADRDVLASLSLKRLPSTPDDPSNAVQRSPAAAELGRRLFEDARFSRDGTVACATCHDPARQFQDGLPVARGVGTGSRRTMPLAGAGHGAWLFWDGRKDSLWAQALGPLEDAAEHGGNRTRDAHLVARNHSADYERVFGAMPDLDGLPMDAGPGGSPSEKSAWDALSESQRESVSRVFSNMGKAIAAYEASLRHEPTRLDRYIDAVVAGEPAGPVALSPGEVRGLRLFIGKAQCASCHNGPLFTDQQFHNTGVPPRDPAKPDRGRAGATAKVRDDEFNCLGPFSDARPAQCQELRFMVTDDPAMEGAFRTPSLRGAAQRPPYMHAGQFATLERVVRHYMEAPTAASGRSELAHRPSIGRRGAPTGRAPIELTDAEVGDLVRFLHTMDADR